MAIPATTGVLIESLFVNKSFILFNGGYKKWGGGMQEVISYNSLIPTMTSDITPSGTASASTINSIDFSAWKAFNGNLDDCWATVNGQLTGWLKYEFSERKVIQKYSITSRNHTERGDLKDWTFEGSNDGVNWIILDIRNSEPVWSQKETREYSFINTNNYKMYRINITGRNNVGSGMYISVGEMKMYEKNIVIPAIPPSWQTVSATLPSVDTFKDEGMNDLSAFNRKPTTHTLPMDDNASSGVVLGSGKVFKEKVDLKKYFDLISLNVK